MDLTDDVETLRNNETIFEPHLHHTRIGYSPTIHPQILAPRGVFRSVQHLLRF